MHVLSWEYFDLFTMVYKCIVSCCLKSLSFIMICIASLAYVLIHVYPCKPSHMSYVAISINYHGMLNDRYVLSFHIPWHGDKMHVCILTYLGMHQILNNLIWHMCFTSYCISLICHEHIKYRLLSSFIFKDKCICFTNNFNTCMHNLGGVYPMFSKDETNVFCKAHSLDLSQKRRKDG